MRRAPQTARGRTRFPVPAPVASETSEDYGRLQTDSYFVIWSTMFMTADTTIAPASVTPTVAPAISKNAYSFMIVFPGWS